MGKTIPGGVYKDAVGGGYHDANGNKVTLPSEKAAEKAIEQAEAASAPPVLAAAPKKARKSRKAKG